MPTKSPEYRDWIVSFSIMTDKRSRFRHRTLSVSEALGVIARMRRAVLESRSCPPKRPAISEHKTSSWSHTRHSRHRSSINREIHTTWPHAMHARHWFSIEREVHSIITSKTKAVRVASSVLRRQLHTSIAIHLRQRIIQSIYFLLRLWHAC